MCNSFSIRKITHSERVDWVHSRSVPASASLEREAEPALRKALGGDHSQEERKWWAERAVAAYGQSTLQLVRQAQARELSEGPLGRVIVSESSATPLQSVVRQWPPGSSSPR